MQGEEEVLEIKAATELLWKPFSTRRVQSAAAKVPHRHKLSLKVWAAGLTHYSDSGHFTKDCFSAPGAQYALVPEEGDEESQQTSTAAQLQDAEKKKKKKVCATKPTCFSLHFSPVLSDHVTTQLHVNVWTLQWLFLLMLQFNFEVVKLPPADCAFLLWRHKAIISHAFMLKEKKMKKKKKRERKESGSDSSSSGCKSKKRRRSSSSVERHDKKKKKHKKEKLHKRSWGRRDTKHTLD